MSQTRMPTVRRGGGGRAVEEAQRRINAWRLAWPGPRNLKMLSVDGRFGAATEKAVEMYQRHEGLFVDGVVGPLTWERLLREPHKATGETRQPRIEGWQKVFVDRWSRPGADKGGFVSATMRETAGTAWQKVVDEAHAAGAIVTSSGARRALGVPASADRALLSVHKTGDAVDLYLYSMGVDPTIDPFVIVAAGKTRGGSQLWRVFARAESGEQVRLEAMTYKAKTVEVRDRFIDFTALASRHGFERIPARSRWIRGKAGAFEAWHFNYVRDNLIGQTTWGEALLRLYPKGDLLQTEEWRYRDFVWNGYGFIRR